MNKKYIKSTTTLDLVMIFMFLIMVVSIFKARASKLKSKIRNYLVLISINRNINRIGNRLKNYLKRLYLSFSSCLCFLNCWSGKLEAIESGLQDYSHKIQDISELNYTYGRKIVTVWAGNTNCRGMLNTFELFKVACFVKGINFFNMI